MQPRNRAPERALDRPLAVPALELPLPSDGGGFDPRAKAPRILSAASPTTISAESGSVILTPGGAPHYRSADGTTGGALATDADLVVAEGRLDALEAMVVAATAGAGAKIVLPEPTGGGTSTVTMQAPALSASRTITVPDADVTLADIATNSALRTTLQDQLVVATVTVADVTGGATDGTLTVSLKRADNSTAIASARQVIVNAGTVRYNHYGALSATLTFATATAGSIIASGAGWALVQTDATGAFACTVSNSADETVYFAVDDASSGISDIATRCAVIGSNNDAATWSA